MRRVNGLFFLLVNMQMCLWKLLINTKIKTPITLLLFLSSIAIFAQRFDIVSAEYNDGIIQVEGEVFIDVPKKSISS